MLQLRGFVPTVEKVGAQIIMLHFSNMADVTCSGTLGNTAGKAGGVSPGPAMDRLCGQGGRRQGLGLEHAAGARLESCSALVAGNAALRDALQ